MAVSGCLAIIRLATKHAWLGSWQGSFRMTQQPRRDPIHSCMTDAISRKLDPVEETAFINQYETLMNGIEADEAVVCVDAVHRTHAVRPVGCWAAKDVPIAVEQSSGRNRLRTAHRPGDLPDRHEGCADGGRD